MGPIAIHRPLSGYAEVRVLRVARRATRQFYRERYLAYWPSHLFRSSPGRDRRSVGGGQGSSFALCRRTASASRTPGNSPSSSSPVLDLFGRLSRAPCSSARPLPAVLFNRARWKLPARIGYLTFNINTLTRPVPQSPLATRRGSPEDTHLRRQSRVYLDFGPLRGQLSSVPCSSLRQWFLILDARVYPVDRIVHS